MLALKVTLLCFLQHGTDSAFFPLFFFFFFSALAVNVNCNLGSLFGINGFQIMRFNGYSIF